MSDLSLRQRRGALWALHIADTAWLNQMAKEHHYLHRPVHVRACPFGWAVAVRLSSRRSLDGQLYQPDGLPSGFVMFSSIHFIKLKGVFGYLGLPTKWQCLHFSHLWLHDNLPSNSESCVIGKAIRQVQKRWLDVHPPPAISISPTTSASSSATATPAGTKAPSTRPPTSSPPAAPSAPRATPPAPRKTYKYPFAVC